MLKYLIILFCIVMQLNSFAQVVIKEEVNLSPKGGGDGIESGLTTPFYGDVSLGATCINLGGNNKITLTVGGTSEVIYGNYPCNPPPAGWGCSGSINGEIENQPAYSPVSVTVEKCNAGNWVNSPIQYGGIINNSAEFYVDIAYPDTPAAWRTGYIGFTEKTPPGNCPNAGGNYCDSSSWVQIPEINLTAYTGNISSIITTACSNAGVFAFFTRPTGRKLTNLDSITSQDIQACYNQIQQTWQFNLNKDIEINYVVELCSTNIANWSATIINSINDTSIIPSNMCDSALKSFLGHKKYPYEIPYGGYVIKEVLLLHENIHKQRYEDFMNNWLFKWETEIETYHQECSTFVNLNEAKSGGLIFYRSAFSKYYAEYTEVRDRFVGHEPKNEILERKEELRVNNYKEVQNLIDKYIDALKKHCNI